MLVSFCERPSKRGEKAVFSNLRWSVHPPSLRHLADVQRSVDPMWDWHLFLKCHKEAQVCEETVFVLESLATKEECADWVFGVRWTPEQFLKQAVHVGHPFSNFSGLPTEVSAACFDVASLSRVDIVNNRCSKLGEWVKLAKTLQQEELRQKELMPAERRRILEGKKLLLMRHIIDTEGYDDKTLVDDVANGFSLVVKSPNQTCCPGNFFQLLFLSKSCMQTLTRQTWHFDT